MSEEVNEAALEGREVNHLGQPIGGLSNTIIERVWKSFILFPR